MATKNPFERGTALQLDDPNVVQNPQQATDAAMIRAAFSAEAVASRNYVMAVQKATGSGGVQVVPNAVLFDERTHRAIEWVVTARVRQVFRGGGGFVLAFNVGHRFYRWRLNPDGTKRVSGDMQLVSEIIEAKCADHLRVIAVEPLEELPTPPPHQRKGRAS